MLRKRETTLALNIEIINTGSELMLGRVLNSHQQWLCRRLADHGYPVSRQVAVADTAAEIQQTVREALERARLVIPTGGLGPTSDDLTRDAIARLLGRALHENAAVRAHIVNWFDTRKRPLPPSTLVQALAPEGSIVLHNACGTAPGLIIQVAPNPFASPDRPEAPTTAWLVMLPGPPRELHPMFDSQVLPWITQQFPREEAFVCRTLKTTGIGESALEERVTGPLAHLVSQGLELGYCARIGEVDLRFTAHGPKAGGLVDEALQAAPALIGAHIYGAEDESLEAVVVRLLTQRRQTVVMAESCTGGRVSDRITNVPGASAVFLGGLITYSNALKQALLGVRPETLETHGAVSEATAAEMAEGARSRHGADYAVAITGIAGPDGGSDAKPVGTVFISLASAAGTRVVRNLNRFDRETFKWVTSQQALELLRQELAKP